MRRHCSTAVFKKEARRRLPDRSISLPCSIQRPPRSKPVCHSGLWTARAELMRDSARSAGGFIGEYAGDSWAPHVCAGFPSKLPDRPAQAPQPMRHETTFRQGSSRTPIVGFHSISAEALQPTSRVEPVAPRRDARSACAQGVHPALATEPSTAPW
jgi:hypothetical protein